MLNMVLPMLNHRKKIEKMAAKAVDAGPKAGAGEKRALLDKLSHLLTHNLCKMRLSTMPLASSVDMEHVASIVSQIIAEAKRAPSKEHTTACSSCLVFVLRSVPNVSDAISAASPCAEAVVEWSTKRTKLSTSWFDEIIVRMPR